MSAYKELEKIFKKLGDINGAVSILSWDSATMMPEGSAGTRADQLSTLSSICHDIICDPKIPELIENAKSQKNNLNNWQKKNLELMEHSWVHATAIPKDLTSSYIKACSRSEMAWRKAIDTNDKREFMPLFKEVVNLVRKIATIKSEKLKCSPYDALLDSYDRGQKSKDIDALFRELRNFLPKVIDKAISKQSRSNIIKGPFPIAKQKELTSIITKAIGFDYSQGRVDVSRHPFCGGTSGDIRITTRYDEDDFSSSLMSVIHENGHAMYEYQLPLKWRGQPVGESLGMSIHESQSLFLEMQICRSGEFFKYLSPLVTKVFNKKISERDLHNLYNKVEPGYIRVDADEVTYPLHVLMRYDIEKLIISKEIEAEDIEDLWNQGLRSYFGLKPLKELKKGWMQDIHWPDGTFGYFPTYTLGAITAAQLKEAMIQQKPEIMQEISKGYFKSLRFWLKNNIHGQASLLEKDQLLKKVTGKPLNLEAFKNYLVKKYL